MSADPIVDTTDFDNSLHETVVNKTIINDPNETSSEEIPIVIDPSGLTGWEQCEYNQAELVKMILGAIQDGTIVVGNAARLQNLSVDDIIALATSEIEIPSIENTIVTNEDGSVTNVIDYSISTTNNITKDTGFVASDYLVYKIVGDNLVFDCPPDLTDKEDLLHLSFTNKPDERWPDQTIDSDLIWNATYRINPLSPTGQYQGFVPLASLDKGITEVKDSSTHPDNPEEHGEFGIQKFFVLMYQKDLTYTTTVVVDPDAKPTIPDGSFISTQTEAAVIPFTYGLNTEPANGVVHADSVDTGDKNTAMIVQSDNEPDNKFNDDPSFKFWNLNFDTIRSIIFQTELDKLIPAMEYINLLGKEEIQKTRIIEQTEATPIPFMEMMNLYHMPNNRIISQKSFDPVAIADSTVVKYDYNRIIMNTDTINAPFNNHWNVNWGITRIIEQIDSIATPFNKHSRAMFNMARIVEQKEIVTLEANTHWKVDFNNNRIIEQKGFDPIASNEHWNYNFDSARIIEQQESEPFVFRERVNIASEPSMIIEQQESEPFVFRERVNINTEAKRIVEQKESDPIDYFNSTIQLNKFDPSSTVHSMGIFESTESTAIINQLAVVPAIFTVSSDGTNPSLQDTKNLHVLTSLNNRLDLAILTAEQLIKETPYQFSAYENQKVFNVSINPLSHSVFREGFKLPKGDYYVEAEKVIFKSPCREGETIEIITYGSFMRSDAVDRNEILNILKSHSTDEPVLVYPAWVYEKDLLRIEIANYDKTVNYNIEVRYDGKLVDPGDMVYKIIDGTILIEAPEIIKVQSRTLFVEVNAYEPGKMASKTVPITVAVKNTYDVDNGNGVIILGETPEEYLGKQVYKINLHENISEPRSELIVPQPGNANTDTPDTILIAKDGRMQTKLVSQEDFTGGVLNASVGIEDATALKIEVMSSSFLENETIINLDNYNIEQIEKAHADGTLYIMLGANVDSTNPERIGYFRPSKTLTQNLTILPRTTNSAYVVHSEKMFGRDIKSLLIFEEETRLDFDFAGYSNIPIDGEDGTQRIPFIDMHEDVFGGTHNYIKFTLNDPNIVNVKNNLINVGSKITVPLDVNIFEQKNTTLEVSDVNGSKIFDGTQEEVTGETAVANLPAIPYTAQKDVPTVMGKWNLIWGDSNGAGASNLLLDIYDNDTDKNKLYLLSDNITRTQESIACCTSGSIVSTITPTGSITPYASNNSFVEAGGYTQAGMGLDPNGDPKYANFIQKDIKIQDLYFGGVTDSIVEFKINPLEDLVLPSMWDAWFTPSLRGAKNAEIEDVYEKILNGIPFDAPFWDKKTKDYIRNPQIAENHSVCSMPNKNGFFIFGGETYEVVEYENPADLTAYHHPSIADEITIDQMDPDYEEIKYRFENKHWEYILGTVKLMNIYYEFDPVTSEPVLRLRWTSTEKFNITNTSTDTRIRVHEYAITRRKVVNKQILYVDVDLAKTKISEGGFDNSDYSGDHSIITRIENLEYQEVFKDPTDIANEVDTWEDANLPSMQGSIYGGKGNIWMITHNAFTRDSEMWQMANTSVPGVVFQKHGILPKDDGVDKMPWQPIRNYSPALGDGPLVARTLSPTEMANPDTVPSRGLYWWTTFTDGLQKKTDNIIPNGTAIGGISEIANISNAYLFTWNKNQYSKITLSSYNIEVMAFTNDLIASLTPNERAKFEVDIYNLNNETTENNLPKDIIVHPNPQLLEVKDIVADNQDYRTKGIQIQYWPRSTQTGRPGKDIIFELTNKNEVALDVNSIRFSL